MPKARKVSELAEKALRLHKKAHGPKSHARAAKACAAVAKALGKLGMNAATATTWAAEHRAAAGLRGAPEPAPRRGFVRGFSNGRVH